MAAVIEEKAVRGLREVALLGFSACALFLLISLLTFNNEDAGWSHSGSGLAIKNACGVVGAWIADFVLSIFGLVAYLFPIMIFWHGYLLYRQKKMQENRWMLVSRWFGFVATVISSAAIFYLHMLRSKVELPGNTGGILGQETGDFLLFNFGNSGTTLLLLAVLLAGVTLCTGLSWLWVMDVVGKYTLLAVLFLYQYAQEYWLGLAERQAQPVKENFENPKPKPKPKQKKTPILDIVPVLRKPEISERAIKEQQLDLFDTGDNVLPALSLLDDRDTEVKGYTRTALEEMSRLVEDILQDFNVVVEVVAVHPGPVITRFEL